MTHTTTDEMLNYLQHTVDAPAKERIQAHISECAACHRKLKQTRQMLNMLQQPDLEGADMGLLTRVASAFRQQQTRTKHHPQQTAQLVYESQAAGAAPGFRGGLMERQLLFSVQDYDIDVQVMTHPITQTHDVHGQILNKASSHHTNLEGLIIHLRDEHDNRYVLTDKYGRFTFSQLVHGQYSLLLQINDQTILLADLHITP